MTAQLPPFRPGPLPRTSPPPAGLPHLNGYPYRPPFPPPMPAAPPVTSTPHVIRGDRNGVGTAGLVLGSIALAFSVIPFVGVVAWVLWPLGATFSGVGLSRANRAVATNRNTALAGAIVSAAAAAVCVGWVIFTAAAASSGAGQ